ncbi:MAG: thioredoxin family protein [Methylacidiphilales bacterium]|nr:thioredoxin family protein [Candidatus Methylacidiphilales bacterium]
MKQKSIPCILLVFLSLHLSLRADTADLLKSDGWEFLKPAELDAKAQNIQKPVLIFFCWTKAGSNGDGITQGYRPILKDIREYYDPCFQFLAVDASASGTGPLSERFHVETIPTLLVLQQGKETGRIIAIRSDAEVTAFLNSKLPDPATIHVTLANAAFARSQKLCADAAVADKSGDTVGALKLYLSATQALVDITQKSPQAPLASDLLQNRATVAGMPPDKFLSDTLLSLETRVLTENLFLLNNLLALKSNDVRHDFSEHGNTALLLAKDGKWDKALALAKLLPPSQQAGLAEKIVSKLSGSDSKIPESAAATVDWAIALANQPETALATRTSLIEDLLKRGLVDKARLVPISEDDFQDIATQVSLPLIKEDDPDVSASALESMKLPLSPTGEISIHWRLGAAYAKAKKHDKAAAEYEKVLAVVSKAAKPLYYLYDNLYCFHTMIDTGDLPAALKIAGYERDGIDRIQACTSAIEQCRKDGNTAAVEQLATFIKANPPKSLFRPSSEYRYSIVRDLLNVDQYACADAVMRSNLANESVADLFKSESGEDDEGSEPDQPESHIGMEMEAIYWLQKTARQQSNEEAVRYYDAAILTYETLMHKYAEKHPDALNVMSEIKAKGSHYTSMELERSRAQIPAHTFDFLYNEALKLELGQSVVKNGITQTLPQIPPGLGLLKTLLIRGEILEAALTNKDPEAYPLTVTWIKDAENAYSQIKGDDDTKSLEDAERSMLSSIVHAGKAEEYAEKEAFTLFLEKELILAAWNSAKWGNKKYDLARKLYSKLLATPPPDATPEKLKSFFQTQSQTLWDMAMDLDDQLAPKGLPAALAGAGDTPSKQIAVLGGVAKDNAKSNKAASRTYAEAAMSVIEQNGIGDARLEDLQNAICENLHIDLANRLAAKMETPSDKAYFLLSVERKLIEAGRWKESQELLDQLGQTLSPDMTTALDVKEEASLCQMQTLLGMDHPAEALTVALAISNPYNRDTVFNKLAAYAALHDTAWPPESKEKIALLARQTLGQPELKSPASIINPFFQ